MTEKVTHNGIDYIIPQNVIDDLLKYHGLDATKEVEDMLRGDEETPDQLAH